MAIQIIDLSIAFGENPIISNLTLTLPEKGLICFWGDSGCGKTTLLNCLAGLIKPDKGEIIIPGQKKISMAFQDHRLLPWYTALDNIMLVCNDQEEALRRLEQTELLQAKDQYPSQLSGGMRSRLTLARALAYRGDILLLDEPFNGLERGLSERLLTEIRAEYKDKTVILITHDLLLAQTYADKIYDFNKNPLH